MKTQKCPKMLRNAPGYKKNGQSESKSTSRVSGSSSGVKLGRRKCRIQSASKQKCEKTLFCSGPPILDLAIVATCLGYTETEVVRAVVKAGIDVSNPPEFLGMVVGLAEIKTRGGRARGEVMKYEYYLN